MLKLWQDLAVWLDQIKMDELTPQKFFLVLEEKDKKYPRDHRFFIRVFLHAFNSHSKLSFSQRKTQSQDWYGTRVYINCAQLAPPERVLKELIGKKIECVFWHNRADDLQKTLHLIQSRLERSFSIGDAEKFWERYSSWCVRSSAPISSLRLSFGTDDFLNVNGHKAYRLSSNRGHAPLGILEWFKPRVEWMEISEVERQIFQILSEDVIFTGGKEGLPAPLAALVRVIACEEIVRLGSQKGFSVSVVMESLREIGWSFLGDEKTLDRFLSKYWSKVSFAGSSLRTWQRIGGVKSVESVRQLKSLRIDKEQKDILTDANAVIISEHFFFLAFALYRILLKSQEFADASTIKTFVGSALGLPPMCPTVDLTISRFGIERLEYQIKARWFWLDSQLF